MFELFLDPRWFSMLPVINSCYCVDSHHVVPYKDRNLGQCYISVLRCITNRRLVLQTEKDAGVFNSTKQDDFL